MKIVLLIFLFSLPVAVTIEAKPKAYYWVVETNTCAKNFSIIRIYDDTHQLIYTEHVEKALDISDRKVTRRLNRKAKKLKSLKDK